MYLIIVLAYKTHSLNIYTGFTFSLCTYMVVWLSGFIYARRWDDRVSTQIMKASIYTLFLFIRSTFPWKQKFSKTEWRTLFKQCFTFSGSTRIWTGDLKHFDLLCYPLAVAWAHREWENFSINKNNNGHTCRCNRSKIQIISRCLRFPINIFDYLYCIWLLYQKY